MIEPNHQTYVDTEALALRFGEKVDLHQIATIYLEELPPVIDSLSALQTEQVDFDAIKRKAHNVIGSFGMLAARPVVETAKELELAAEQHRELEVRRHCGALLGHLGALSAELEILSNED